MKYDVAVLGAGPVGSVAAERASKDNDVVLVGSEHRVQCAGLISTSGLGRLGINPGNFVINRVRGAKLFSPLGFQTTIDGGVDKALVVDRRAFDEHLLGKAVDSGVKYVSSTVEEVDGHIKTSGGEKFSSDKIVVATGTNYTLQRRMGLEYPRNFLMGVQYEMEVECDREYVELHFIVPDFFAWVIPADGCARVGLCTRKDARQHLDGFVKKLKSSGRLKSDRKISELYGIVPIHEPSLKTQYGRIVTVGDAAGHVKASTGGGVVLGCLAAEFACSENYEVEWRKRVGGELKLHLMFHRFLSSLKPGNLDRLLRMVDRYRKDIEEGGDMDYASHTFRNLLVNPKLAVDLALNMPFFLRDLL